MRITHIKRWISAECNSSCTVELDGLFLPAHHNELVEARLVYDENVPSTVIPNPHLVGVDTHNSLVPNDLPNVEQQLIHNVDTVYIGTSHSLTGDEADVLL